MLRYCQWRTSGQRQYINFKRHTRSFRLIPISVRVGHNFSSIIHVTTACMLRYCPLRASGDSIIINLKRHTRPLQLTTLNVRVGHNFSCYCMHASILSMVRQRWGDSIYNFCLFSAAVHIVNVIHDYTGKSWAQCCVLYIKHPRSTVMANC
jgi:hypothetical protein